MTSTFHNRPRLSFDDVHQQELFEIKKRREKNSYDPAELDEAQPELVGLALSGGGIRSATFCLGFLQELQRLRLLRIFDYLSTVSGGGYLGGWWSAWLSRQQNGVSQDPFFNVEDISDPVNLLRRINESHDSVARDFKTHLQSSARGQKLLQALERKELRQLAPRLYEPLANELNTYINRAATDDEKQLRKTDLINTFPCELRGIFPQPEQIEPERRIVRVSRRDSYEVSSDGDPIHHVRLFADHLTPRKGILSAGTWRAITTITRNLILTWLILLSLFVGLMILGQAYLFLHPASQMVTCLGCAGDYPTGPDYLRVPLLVMLTPIVILLVSNVILGIAWLLSNQETSSSLDSITQWACLVALAALLIAALFAIPSLRAAIVTYFALPFTLKYLVPGPWSAPFPAELATHVTRLRVVVIWLTVLLGYLLILWHWRLNRGYAGSTAPASSKREIRRGRCSRAQSGLLVTTVIVAAVLLVSWLTPVLLRQNRLMPGMQIPLALLPLLWNLRGSIFATLEDTPAFFGDRAVRKKASLPSRIIFAATPMLVVGVLAIAAAAFAHWLLLNVYYQNSGVQKISVLNVTAPLAIAFCMGLAIYELKAVPRFSLLVAVFMGLVMIDTVWGAHVLLRYTNYAEGRIGTYLLVTSACVSLLMTILVFRKVIPKGKWRWRLFLRSSLVRPRTRGDHEKRIKVLRMLSLGGVVSAIVLFAVLTVVGFLIGYALYLNTTESRVGKISGAVVLTLLALGGGVILFRFLLRREKTLGRTNLSLRFFSDKTIGQHEQALWLAQSVCVTLPLAMISVYHYIFWHGQAHLIQEWDQSPTIFPLAVGFLAVSLVVLRSLVIQKQLLEGKPILTWSSGIMDWLLKGTPRRRVYQALAVGSICSVALLDTITRVISSGDTTAALLSGSANWKLLPVAVLVLLPVFAISIFQLPFTPHSYPLLRAGKRSWIHSKVFLWLLSIICIGLAFIAGLLLPKWLVHVSEIPLHSGLTPVLLPLAAGCFLIVLFELFWGEGDNRRSVVLVGFAYLAVTTMFFIQLTGAGLNWFLVLGLLTAICVWVGALGWIVDPNSVSMHQFYKERLVRVYLGASNMRRYHFAREITDTVTGDDLPLTSILNCERGGPYHLINTTLNLVAGRNLATTWRSSAPFVLSQKYCGSRRTDYCHTNEYMRGEMTLGTAVATSGAPVSPNAGTKNPTASMAMLMTLLNVRLGYWAPTPNRRAQNSLQPRLWPVYLVREFFSQTNDLQDYCYLSDGGDFDNTGLYSLIERGCRFVVLVDCGADSKPPCFEDLGEAIRRCRIDFGAEISLDLAPLTRSESPSCFVVGRIKFAEKHLRSLGRHDRAQGFPLSQMDQIGVIVYFKPSVIPNVTADVWQYAMGNEYFPQQPTADRWFGEAQFESYRRLGQVCAHTAFGRFRSENDLENNGRLSTKKIETLFMRLLRASS